MTTEATKDRTWLLEQTLDDARWAVHSCNDPTAVVVIADGEDKVGRRIARLFLTGAEYRQQRDHCRSLRQTMAVTAAFGREQAVVLFGDTSPDAEARLRRPAPPGTFTAMIVDSGGTTFTFVPTGNTAVTPLTPEATANRVPHLLPTGHSSSA